MPLGLESALRLPHLNRLTGLRWWKQLPLKDESQDLLLASESKISNLLRTPNPCAIGKIGTTELMGLEYLYRFIQLPWPPAASWKRPAQRLYECSGIFPVRRDIYLRWAGELHQALRKMDALAQWQPPATYLSVVEDRVLAHVAPQSFRVHRNYANPPASARSLAGRPTKAPLAGDSSFCRNYPGPIASPRHLGDLSAWSLGGSRTAGPEHPDLGLPTVCLYGPTQTPRLVFSPRSTKKRHGVPRL